MDIQTFAEFIRTQSEPLQYAAFFGSLLVLGALDIAFPGGVARPHRWPANVGLTALNIVVLGAVPVGALTAADFAQAQGWGALNLLDLSWPAAIAAGFALRSLVSYAVHVSMHKAPVFWRIHRVHHSDPTMDVSTTVRFHPAEFLITMPIVAANVVLFGISPLAVILYEIFDAAMAVFTHTNLRLPAVLERMLGLILVTPNMHRIHHSAEQPETDSNYGATFSWWDRLFGTLRTRTPEDLTAMRLGLDDWIDGRTDSLMWLLSLPFRRVPLMGQRHGAVSVKPTRQLNVS